MGKLRRWSPGLPLGVFGRVEEMVFQPEEPLLPPVNLVLLTCEFVSGVLESSHPQSPSPLEDGVAMLGEKTTTIQILS